MSKWSIDKEFHWEMGHRVWSQKLDRPDLSVSTECACKNLHGHSYAMKVELSSNELDHRGFVIDFKELNFVKQFVDDVLDHKFMVDVNDPNFQLITSVDPGTLPGNVKPFTNLLDLVTHDDPSHVLHLGGFVLVNFVPTSENICKHIKQWVQDRLGTFATVTAIDLWETKKSHCRYED